MIRPDEIQCIGHEVAIRWQDGTEDYLPMEQLRALSPSAEQQGERDLLGNTIGGTSRREYPGVSVTGWVPVGGYGIQFSFSDGHRTGIYSFAYLKDIARSLSA
jgi:DUF971 family protein